MIAVALKGPIDLSHLSVDTPTTETPNFSGGFVATPCSLRGKGGPEMCGKGGPEIEPNPKDETDISLRSGT